MLRAFPAQMGQWLNAQIVPGYSDGLAPDLNRLPADRKRCLLHFFTSEVKWGELSDLSFRNQSLDWFSKGLPPPSVVHCGLAQCS
jgi:hypothetical protein